MKKRLEAELISIAHRILKLKNKSEVDQLYLETRKLYETLSVLKFYGDNYDQVKSDVSNDELEEKLTNSLEEKTTAAVIETPKLVQEEVAVAETTEEPVTVTEEQIAETKEVEVEEETVIVGEITIDEEDADIEVPVVDEKEEELVVDEKSDLTFEPIFELAAEAPFEDVGNLNKVEIEAETPKKETKQISFEDLLGENYSEPIFVKPNDIVVPDSLKNIIEEKPLSLNDQHLKSINIGLNDKMAFVKHLFADDNEDYNRVLSQLNTFSTYEEAKDFIEEIIKPDYNNWDGADDYAERFLGIVAKKFS